MKIISLMKLKGGTGATTTAREMACILNHQYKKDILLVDNDPQGNLSAAAGVRIAGNCGTAKLISRAYGTVNSLIKTTGLTRPESENVIDIIPANMSLLATVWKLRDDNLENYRELRKATTKTGKPYDYIIIDNPPSMEISVINAIVAADEVISPVSIDEWSLGGLETVMEKVDLAKQINPELHFLGALVTMYQNNDYDIAGLEWMQHMQIETFETPIKYSKKVKESTFHAQPLTVYSPRSAAAISYKRFVKEYLDKTGGA